MDESRQQHNDPQKLQPWDKVPPQVSPDDVVHLSHQDIQQLVQKLQTFHIELELQNEELRQIQQQLETARSRYAHLFDFAPVGYVTLTPQGRILEANQTMAQLLSLERAMLHNQPFTTLLVWDDRDRFDFHRREVLDTGTPQHCELRMQRQDGTTFRARLDSVVEAAERQHPLRWRTAVSDISMQHRLQQEILDISEREQQRLGQELHDSAGQQLTGIAFLAQSLSQQLRASSSPQAPTASLIVGHLRQLTEQLRHLARGFYPVEMDQGGLTDALHALAARTEQLFGVSCRVVGHYPPHLPDSTVALHLYRIAQEAVINAIKHGQAQQITIRPGSQANRVVLSIQDDGTGLSEPQDTAAGMGIHLMRYRASMIGAVLTIQQRPQGGTEVVCAMPIAAASATC